MADADREWNSRSGDVWEVPSQIDAYIRRVHPVFEETRRALSDHWRLPKMVLRKAGAILLTGVGVGLGTALVGPVGSLLGAGAADGIKALVRDLAKKGGELTEKNSATIDKSMMYLFHAQ